MVDGSGYPTTVTFFFCRVPPLFLFFCWVFFCLNPFFKGFYSGKWMPSRGSETHNLGSLYLFGRDSPQLLTGGRSKALWKNCESQSTYMRKSTTSQYMGVSKIGVPQNGWFIMENPIKIGWFGGTTIFGNIHIAIISTVYRYCKWLHPLHLPDLCTNGSRVWGKHQVHQLFWCLEKELAFSVSLLNAAWRP